MGSDDFIEGLYNDMQEATAGLSRRPTRRKKRAVEREDDDHIESWTPSPGMAKSRGVSWRHPRTLGDVVNVLSAQPQWRESLSLGTLIAQWSSIVGDDVAKHCSIESFEEGKLFIQADSTAWAKQMQLLLPQIEKRISDTVGQGSSPQVIVHGPRPPSWKHGLYSVKGRGPRDTYG